MTKPNYDIFSNWLGMTVDELNLGMDPYKTSKDHFHFLEMFKAKERPEEWPEVDKLTVISAVPAILNLSSEYVKMNLLRKDLVLSIECSLDDMEEDTPLPELSNKQQMADLLYDSFNVSFRFHHRNEWSNHHSFFPAKAIKMKAPPWIGENYILVYHKVHVEENLIVPGIDLIRDCDDDYFPWPVDQWIGFFPDGEKV